MNTSDLLEKIQEIFSSLLDRDDFALTPQTTARDVEGWDSLTHIQLIAAIEAAFKIKFTALQIYNFKNVGDICESISQQQADQN